jgi:hypothetical protein
MRKQLSIALLSLLSLIAGGSATPSPPSILLSAPAAPAGSLIAYLQGLSANAASGNTNILIGQHANYFPSTSSNPINWTSLIHSVAASYGQMDPCTTSATAASLSVPAFSSGNQCGGTSTGFAPAMIAVTMGTGTPGATIWSGDSSGTTTTVGLSGSPMNGLGTANDLCANNYIVTVFSDIQNPANVSSSSVNIANVLTSGNSLNTQLLSYVDNFASILKGINCKVLVRLLHEENLSNSWWWSLVSGNGPGGGTTTGQQQAQLFQLIHDRLVITDGVTNALWVYNVNSSVGNYVNGYCQNTGGTTCVSSPSYSIANDVDIVSYDCYFAAPFCGSDAAYTALTALGKPIMMFEAGCANSPPSSNTCDNNAYLNDLVTNAPLIIGVQYFAQEWALSQQQNALATMTNAHALTHANLPSGVNLH